MMRMHMLRCGAFYLLAALALQARSFGGPTTPLGLVLINQSLLPVVGCFALVGLSCALAAFIERHTVRLVVMGFKLAITWAFLVLVAASAALTGGSWLFVLTWAFWAVWSVTQAIRYYALTGTQEHDIYAILHERRREAEAQLGRAHDH
jgi:hypothetical protein